MEPMIKFSGHLRPQLPIIRSSTRLLSFTELQQESVYLRCNLCPLLVLVFCEFETKCWYYFSLCFLM
ncbi:hypothetical protein Hanom_Chr16g01420141 [Helianthus anomalus]